MRYANITSIPSSYIGAFFSSLVPASALSSWGSIPQLGNKKMYCICLSRHRALPSKCRRGDASPPGEGSIPQFGNEKMYCICLSGHRALPSKCRRGDASPPGEDVMPPGEGSIPQLGNKKMYSEVIKIMHEYGYMM